MKKIVLLTILIIYVTSIHAQIAKNIRDFVKGKSSGTSVSVSPSVKTDQAAMAFLKDYNGGMISSFSNDSIFFNLSSDSVLVGYIPDSLFDKVVANDYKRLGLVKGSLPQTSAIIDWNDKNLQLNYTKIVSNTGRPIAIRGAVDVGFDNNAMRSSFIADGNLAPNIKFTGGLKIFRYAKASYFTKDKDKLKMQINSIDNNTRRLVAKLDSINNLPPCCKNADELKNYYQSFLKGKADPGFLAPTKSELIHILQARDTAVTEVYLKAPFSKKTYGWFDIDFIYDRPQINTLNRNNALPDRLSSRIFSNTQLSFAYNHLMVYKKTTQYFIGKIKYASQDNSSSLSSADVNYLKRYDSLNGTVYFEKTNKKAYYTTHLKKTPLLDLGFEYYFFYNKVVGFTASVNFAISDEIPDERKFNMGVIFPVVKSDKTKATLTLFYEAASNSRLVLSGKYTNQVGFKVGLPIDMFAE